MTRHPVVRFWGHATFSVEYGTCHVCIDPYEAGAFGGKVALPPLPDIFTHVVCSHAHLDHNAWHTIPKAQRIFDGFAEHDVRLLTRAAFHDEHQGRLRGGSIDLLDLRFGQTRIVHCGDLGERPAGALLDFIATPRPDVLIVPVGGHFTLDADGAAELVANVRPGVAIGCHSADDGTTFAELAPRSLFTMRFESVSVVDELCVRPHDDSQVVVLRRTSHSAESTR